MKVVNFFNGKKTYIGAVVAGVSSLMLVFMPDLSPEGVEILVASKNFGLTLFGIGTAHKLDKTNKILTK